jgi:NAD(P)-dependent dehydrogenase (short-subunit alcohol dehydrogenase family)
MGRGAVDRTDAAAPGSIPTHHRGLSIDAERGSRRHRANVDHGVHRRPGAEERRPPRDLPGQIDIDDVGVTTAYLATPYARRLTGTTVYVDGGLSIMA